jgi:hypothetical protein
VRLASEGGTGKCRLGRCSVMYFNQCDIAVISKQFVLAVLPRY